MKTTNNLLLILATLLCLASVTAEAVSFTDLIGYWPADGSAVDAAQGNNGSFNGNYVPGRPGAGQAFDLATGKVVIGDLPAYDFQQYAGWSVGFWFNVNGTPINSQGTFLGQDVSAGEYPKWFIDYSYGYSGAFEVHLNNFGSNPRVFLPSQQVSIPNGWNQFTLVKHPGFFEFYLNGQEIGTQPYGGIIPNPNAPLEFGFAEPCCQSSVFMDDVVLYRTDLNSDQVAELAGLQSVPERGSAAAGAGCLFLLHSLLRRKTAQTV